jgi:hypothetical protein
MSPQPRRISLAAPWTLAIAFVLGATALGLGLESRRPSKALPERLSDKEFWHLVTSMSEPGGYFRSDNFVSNELSFQEVLPALGQLAAPDGVYLGVGPEQNFTYIAALKPRIAFIFDIRRQNMLQHLLYKALIEQARDRADFLSLLFARPRPPGLDSSTGPDSLFAAFARAAPDSALFAGTLAAVDRRLLTQHHFTLSQEDVSKIAYVYTAFFLQGPALSYSFSSPPRWGFGHMMPTYAELMTATDGQGHEQSYLATEDGFRALKRLEEANLIVPLVGDFAGKKAIRAVARYLKARRAAVTAFYTSNVEQYLFRQDDDWQRFYANVATLPLEENSAFIRAIFNFGGFWYRDPADPNRRPGPRSATVLSPIAEQLLEVHQGRIASYYDLIEAALGTR